MKGKTGCLLIAAVMGISLLTACGSIDSATASETAAADSTVSDSDPASDDSTSVQADSSDATAQDESSDKITVTGSATLTVRKLLPDYVLDETTMQCAVVTKFQDTPYIIDVGEDIVSELQEGETYVFEIEDTEVDKNFVMQDGALVEKAVFTNYPVKIKSVRKADENEIGLASKQLEIK